MVVYVISITGKPLMPTRPSRARKKLKAGLAKCICKTPFTIKLLYETTEYTQPLIHGVDTGSSRIGSAVIDSKNNVVYMSEVEIRNDISDKMTQRAKYRRNRRNRKTRYRKARWLNRKNSKRKNRFSPTMTSKLNSHLREVRFVRAILPVTKTILETATFDPHALKNPAVLKNKWLYQRGINYGYANTKAYILHEDGYLCRHCKGNSKDDRLEVHHIIFKSNGGSDEPENLILLCKTCHDKVHSGTLDIEGGRKKGTLNHATQMNSIRVQLLHNLNCEETFGFVTKEHRQLWGLSKSHSIDAVVIASQGSNPNFKTESVFLKKCVADGDYQQTKGVRSEQPIQTRKIQGFRKFDKVKYLGCEYFIKGRMSTGYAILMDMHGKKQKLKPIPKFDKMKRLSARKSWIIQAETIQNIV
jgi:5-methylcytosine-specific restriction endonuclease McrA